jgi:hypothetical protein
MKKILFAGLLLTVFASPAFAWKHHHYPKPSHQATHHAITHHATKHPKVNHPHRKS